MGYVDMLVFEFSLDEIYDLLLYLKMLEQLFLYGIYGLDDQFFGDVGEGCVEGSD